MYVRILSWLSFGMSGKTTIANFIANATDNLSVNTNEPTAGVRILEFDFNLQGDVLNIELWDSSGDHQ